MTFDVKSLEVVNAFVDPSARKDTKNAKAEIVIYEVSVMLRNLFPKDGWDLCAQNLMFLLTTKFTEELNGCKGLIMVLDNYLDPCTHRGFVKQSRAPRPKPENLNVADFQDLRTARLPTSDEFNWLVGNREWRTTIFTPWLAHTMSWPCTGQNIEFIYLRSFNLEISKQPSNLPVERPLVDDPLKPLSPYLVELFLERNPNDTSKLRPRLRYVNEVESSWLRIKTCEADSFTATCALWALKSRYTVHIISGDGDLVEYGSMVEQLYRLEEDRILKEKKLFVTIDSQLKGFDIVLLKKSVEEKWIKIVKEANPNLVIPPELIEQFPMLFCIMLLLGSGDTSSSVPQITPVNIAKALGSYIAAKGRFKSPPPAIMCKKGVTNLLPEVPHDYMTFIFFDQDSNPHINPGALLSLIQHAGNFTWYSKPTFFPETVPGTNRHKRKVMSVAFVLAHVMRTVYTVGMMIRETTLAPGEIDMLDTNMTGYDKIVGEETIYEVDEIFCPRVPLEKFFSMIAG